MAQSQARLQTVYREKIAPELIEKFGYTSVMQVFTETIREFCATMAGFRKMPAPMMPPMTDIVPEKRPRRRA